MGEREEYKAEDCREEFSRDWGISYPWFRTYSEAMKEWLSYIKVPRPEADRDIPVIYSTPERAFADYISPRVESRVDLPVISFALTSATMDKERFRPTYIDVEAVAVGDGYRMTPRYQPWELNYNVSIWAKFYDTLDNVAYRILSRFTPGSYLSVQGATALIELTSMNDNSQLETGGDDRVLRHDYQFKVNAWMPMPYEEVGRIENVIFIINNTPPDEIDPDNPNPELDGLIDDTPCENPLVEDGVGIIVGDFPDPEPNPNAHKVPGVYTTPEIDSSVGDGNSLPNKAPGVYTKPEID